MGLGGLTCRPLSVNGGDQRDEGAGRPQSSGCEGCGLENGSYSTSGVDFPNTEWGKHCCLMKGTSHSTWSWDSDKGGWQASPGDAGEHMDSGNPAKTPGRAGPRGAEPPTEPPSGTLQG